MIIYEAQLPDGEWNSGISNISLVRNPAIESDFQKFSINENKVKIKFNEEQRSVVGALLIPNKLIYREDDSGNPYYLRFSSDVIKEMRDKMMSDGTVNCFSLHHETYDLASYKIRPQEVWIKESENDKSNDYGLELPIGSLVLMAKINDDKLWSRVKENEFNGFSIESVMNYKIETMEKFYFAKKEVGATVLKNKDGVTELFTGTFKDGEDVITAVDGIISAIDKEVEKKPQTIDDLKTEFSEMKKSFSDVKALLEELKASKDSTNVVDAIKKLAEKQEEFSKQTVTLSASDKSETAENLKKLHELFKKFK